jgi:hypothetical protein
MGLFNFFKKSKTKPHKEARNEKPSDHELAFAEMVFNIIGPTVEKHGFGLHRRDVKQYSTMVIWRKKEQYIKIESTTHPADHPYYYNIVLGEGEGDTFIEYDWNSVAIWAVARVINSNTEIVSYDFPYGHNVKPSVEEAHKHLLTYGQSFLQGDLTNFYTARRMVNKDREPYKIYSPGKDGKYQTTDEPKSVEQKKKYT